MSISVLILGMHRSGTSALAGALNMAGLYLGQRLTPGREDNPKGYFEHDEIWRIHQGLLASLSSDWDDPRTLPEGWRAEHAAIRARADLSAIVDHDFRSSALWGVKDPRLSRLFTLWPGIIREMGAELRVILTMRDPVEVAQSLALRNGIAPSHGLAVWLRNTLEAERATRTWPRAVHHYPNLLADWRQELARIDTALGLGLPPRSPEQDDEIENFLDVGLRHQRVVENELAAQSDNPVAAWCARAFDAMSAAVDDERRAIIMDEITAEFDAWERQASPLCAQIAYYTRQAHARESSLRLLQDERDSLAEQLERSLSQRRQDAREAEAVRAAELMLAKRRIDALTRQLAGDGRARDGVGGSWRVTAPMRRTLSLLRGPRSGPAEANAGLEREEPSPPAIVTPDDAAPSPAHPNASGGLSRILIVTPDIHGPVRNGGIGTAFAALAVWLARWNFDVSVLYALDEYTESEPIARWRDYYAEKGVELIPLSEAELGKLPALRGSSWSQVAWKVHAWLKSRQDLFQLVIFPEWMGLGYYVLLSKGQGLDYRNLRIAVNAHSPESWAIEGNRALPDSPDALDREFMERESVRRADWLISPSEYMLGWMRAHRWQLPERRLIIQNLLSEAPYAGLQVPDRTKIDELAFFGRLELRKGLRLFCDAIDRLSPDERDRVGKIVFLGKSAIIEGQESRDYIDGRSEDWTIPVEILTDRDREGALDRLARPGTLAVIASLLENSPYTVLECLHHGIRFIATAVGGIPELIHPDDRDDALFDPSPASLSRKIADLLDSGAAPARVAVPQDDVRRMWRDWLAEAAAGGVAAAPPAEKAPPSISVCLVHYDRPALLDKALRSLRLQTYENFEVVLVDDGSPSEEAQAFLDSLEPEFQIKEWRLVRQDNRYLGAARNRAAQEASGEYLLFMDDDNVAMPNELEVFAHAALHSGADILTCAVQIFRGDVPPDRPQEIWLPLGGAAGSGLYRNVFGDANALWRRDAFIEIGGYTTDHGLGHEDWELFAEAVLRGLRLEMIPELLFWYRVHAASMLRTGDSWADHARSVRPYVRHDPSGLGLAGAFAVCLLQSHIAQRNSANAEDRRASRRGQFFHGVQLGVLTPTFERAPQPTGRTLALEIPEIADEILDSGWSTPEPSGVWSLGPAARLRFKYTQPDSPLIKLTVWAHAFVRPPAQSQTIDVLAGSLQIATWQVPQHPSEFTAFFPASNDPDALLELTFRIGDPVSPRVIGHNSDVRELGLWLTAIRLDPAEENAASSAMSGSTYPAVIGEEA